MAKAQDPEGRGDNGIVKAQSDFIYFYTEDQTKYSMKRRISLLMMAFHFSLTSLYGQSLESPDFIIDLNLRLSEKEVQYFYHSNDQLSGIATGLSNRRILWKLYRYDHPGDSLYIVYKQDKKDGLYLEFSAQSYVITHFKRGKRVGLTIQVLNDKISQKEVWSRGKLLRILDGQGRPLFDRFRIQLKL